MDKLKSKASLLSKLQQAWLPKGIPALDFSLLVSHVTQKTKVELLTLGDFSLNNAQAKNLEELLARRLQEEPLAYLTGHKEFFGHDFLVNKDTLIPRPESECLLEDMIQVYEESTEKPRTCVDIGTGSGALIISLSLALPATVRCIGSDVSPAALKVAEENKARLTSPAIFLKDSLLEPYTEDLLIPGPLFIIANLPYVSLKFFQESPKSVQGYEPESALLSENEGMAHYQALLQEMTLRLRTVPFTAWFEISPEQTNSLRQYILSTFPEAHVFVGQDLSHRNRFIRFTQK
jgi:release factor glutamine methyltransferase